MYRAYFRCGLSTKYWQPTVDEATKHNLALLSGEKEWKHTDIVQTIYPGNGSYYHTWDNDQQKFVNAVR